MNQLANNLQLRDIHLPDGISWWPPALGWWLVLIIAVALIVLGVMLYRYRQRRLLHRAAKLELDKIKLAFENSADEQQLIQSLSIWLRRVCLSFYPRIDVAGLTGQAWLEFLDQPLCKSKQPHRFSEDAGSVIIHAPYQLSLDIDTDYMLTLCQIWLQALPRRREITQ